jgi:hypothetical protein
MLKTLALLSFVVYLGIGVASYWMTAGAEADWDQLVTYLWVCFWPFVIVLILLYFRPLIFLVLAAAIFIGWPIARQFWRRSPSP